MSSGLSNGRTLRTFCLANRKDGMSPRAIITDCPQLARLSMPLIADVAGECLVIGRIAGEELLVQMLSSPGIVTHKTTASTALALGLAVARPAAVTAGAMIGIHAGRYADDAIRWVFFPCGVGGSIMVASGLVLWAVKRREKLADPTRPHLGSRLVARLNIGFDAGFPTALVGYLWANRVLPPLLPDAPRPR